MAPGVGLVTDCGIVAFVSARLDEEERDARAAVVRDGRWVKALWALVTTHYPSGPWCKRCLGIQSDTHEGWPCDVIKGIAAIWAWHPDYQQEWVL